MYEKILEDAFQLEEGNEFWHFLMFLTKPGVVAGVLLTMWLVSYEFNNCDYNYNQCFYVFINCVQPVGQLEIFYVNHLQINQKNILTA